MQLTFTSRSLQRTVSLEDLPVMANSELRELHAELLMSVQTMDEKMQEAKELERLTGVAGDQDWLHRVKKKRRICVTFASQAEQAMNGGSSSFDSMYRLKLEELVLDELGEETWQEIKGEAMKFALANRPLAVLSA
jgi:hypothetical protein